jgi:hypothetical protein
MVAEPVAVPAPVLEDAPGLAGTKLIEVVDGADLDLPNEFLLASLADRRLRLLGPIAVRIERENGDCIAEATEFDEFGFGENWTEAVADLRRALTQLYWSLTTDESRLGPDLAALLARFKGKIRQVA